MKLTSRYRIGLFAVLVLGALTGFEIRHAKVQQVRKPMLIQTEWQHRDARSGAMQPTMVTTEAFRADGSWSQDTLIPQGTSPSRIVAIIPTRQITHYNTLVRMRTSRTLGDELYSRYSETVPRDCLAAHPGPGTATCVDNGANFLGYHVLTLTRIFTAASDPAYTSVELVAPDLDLRTLSYSLYQSGALIELRLARYVVVGEPAPGLFTVPNDLPLVTPAVYNKAAYARF